MNADNSRDDNPRDDYPGDDNPGDDVLQNSEPTESAPTGKTTWTGPRKRWVPVVVLIGVAISAAGLTWLLTTIFSHRQEALHPFTKVVELTDTTYDPSVWGQNFPRQYEAYRNTIEMPEDAKVAREPTAEDPRTFTAKSKLEADPRLVTMWQGYAFSVDYRKPRGHEWMLTDQEYTRRMTEFKQPGACLNCHASTVEVMDELGKGDQQAGFHAMNKLPYAQAAQHVKGPVACIDCHDPQTMALRVTRPAFIEGIKEYMAGQGIKDFDPNRDATNQQMRAFVCAQCHVEYYFAGDEKTLTFPWDKGLSVYDAMAYYDEIGWKDFEHKDTKAQIIKAQHPDYETWSNGIHAANGVTCADCHMSFQREGAAKVSDHQIASPMRSEASINSTCLTCHRTNVTEMKGRVEVIQTRWEDAKNVSFAALDDLIRDLTAATKDGSATPAQLDKARDFQRKAQFIVDYSVSENSNGFHAPGYSISILNQATDWARSGQLVLRGVDVTTSSGPVASTQPARKS